MSSIPGDFARNICRCADSECEHRQEMILELPKKKEDRVKGQIYINKKGKKGIWNGRILHCEHGRQKSRCKECGGSQICDHGQIISTCKECGGGSICKHGKRKTECKKCGGSRICEHHRIKSKCKECGGGSICEHGKQKSQCKECGGSSICEHHRIKSTCKECGGSSICEHGKFKSTCKECGGSALCKNQFCETISSKKYDGYCMPCFINNPLNADKPAHRNYKTKEKEVALAITKRYPDATWILDKRIQDGCSARRPDVLLDLGYHVLMIEVDENRHDNYDCSCENKRLMQLAQDIGHRNMVVIRFNPDAYETSQGERVPSCWKLNKLGVVHIPKDQQNAWNDRLQQLLDTIQYWIENESEKQIEMVELFYG